MENSMERHRRFKEQAGEIVNYAKAFGPFAAMDKFDIRSVFTLEKILERGDANAKMPSKFNRGLYADSDSYYDGLVKGIIHHIRKMEDKVDLLLATLAFKDTEIDQLKVERQKWFAIAREHEEQVMEELLNIVGENG